MFYVTDLQAVEPDALEPAHGVRVDVDPELDEMGFPRVTVRGDTRERLLAYIHENWSGDEDPEWFQRWVVERVCTTNATA